MNIWFASILGKNEFLVLWLDMTFISVRCTPKHGIPGQGYRVCIYWLLKVPAIHVFINISTSHELVILKYLWLAFASPPPPPTTNLLISTDEFWVLSSSISQWPQELAH